MWRRCRGDVDERRERALPHACPVYIRNASPDKCGQRDLRLPVQPRCLSLIRVFSLSGHAARENAAAVGVPCVVRYRRQGLKRQDRFEPRLLYLWRSARSLALAATTREPKANLLIHESPPVEGSISGMSLGVPASRRHRAKRERVLSGDRGLRKVAGRRLPSERSLCHPGMIFADKQECQYPVGQGQGRLLAPASAPRIRDQRAHRWANPHYAGHPRRGRHRSGEKPETGMFGPVRAIKLEKPSKG